MSYKEKQDLVEAARNYAKHDEYSVTRNYLNALCDEIERLRELNKNVFSRIQDNRDVFEDAERYYWLKTNSWDLPEDVIAPTVLMCDGRMTKWEWVTGIGLDEAIDKFRLDNK
jgi:hypothetical protein